MTATFLVYILKWALSLSLLYSLFRLCLRRDTFHAFNRTVLLTILIMSIALPLCHIQTDTPLTITERMEEAEVLINDMPGNYTPTEAVTETVKNYEPKQNSTIDTAASDWNRINIWLRLLIFAYASGLLIAWGSYFRSLISLFILIARSKRVKIDGLPSWVRVVESKVRITPCSWMCWIILSPGELSRATVMHELAHIKFRHSLDLLLAEYTARMLWFLPIGWMLLEDLKNVHEYQVDRSILQEGFSAEEYQKLLINQATIPSKTENLSFSVANSLIRSTIKQRLAMMYQKPSSHKAMLKALYIIPCSLIALTVFAKSTAINDIQTELEKENAVAPLLSLVSIDDKEIPVIDIDMLRNTKPVLTQEATADYDMKNGDTYSIYENPVVAPVETYVAKMEWFYTLVTRPEATYVTAKFHQAWDKWFYLFSSNIMIIDAETRTQYKLRKLHHYPVDKCFWVHCEEDKTVDFLLEFPPLPKDVKKIKFYMHHSQHGCTPPNTEFNTIHKQSATYEVKDLAPEKGGIINRQITPHKEGSFDCDLLPENRTPILIKPKTSLYNDHNFDNFPLYEDFQTVPAPRGKRLGYSNTSVEIYRTKKATYVVSYCNTTNHDNDDWLFFRFSSGVKIIDADTGKAYQVKALQHFPFDTFFWLHKNARTIHQFVFEFPPMPESVKRIKFRNGYAPDRYDFRGDAYAETKVYNIEDFYPKEAGTANSKEDKKLAQLINETAEKANPTARKLKLPLQAGVHMVVDDVTVVCTRSMAENYSEEDGDTYPILENPLTVSESELDLPEGAWHFSLECSDVQTRLTAVFHQPEKEWFYKFSPEISLTDEYTGKSYKTQSGPLPYTDICNFWLRRGENKYIKFYFLFPPLPKDINEIGINWHNSVYGNNPGKVDFSAHSGMKYVMNLESLLLEHGGTRIPSEYGWSYKPYGQK